MFVRKIYLSFLLILCLFNNLQAEIERRAAFDLGSGSIKLLVADFDTDTETIEKYIYSRTAQISLSGDLAKKGDGLFSQNIQQEAKRIVHVLKLEADEHGAEHYAGVATEAYRLAQNGQELLSQISHAEGFTIKLISQKEEAELGFATAVAHSKGNPHNAVVWDIGNGSFQITWMEEGHLNSYMKHLGKTPVKNLIISEVQGKDTNDENSPNPISQDQFHLARSLLINVLGEVPENLLAKIVHPSSDVYGVGAIHNGNITISTQQFRYTLETVNGLITDRLDLPDTAFAVNAPEFWVSDLIFISAVMSHLNIPSIINVKAFDDPNVASSGNTIGIIVWPEYWQQFILKLSSCIRCSEES